MEVEDVGNSFDAASSELIEIKEIEELPLEPGTVFKKIKTNKIQGFETVKFFI